jgi:hypothetical protein
VTKTEPTLADENEADPATGYVVEPLGSDTWDSYARLIERHNGVFGGCWCTYFHTMSAEKTYPAEDNRVLKQAVGQRGPSPCRAGVRRRRGGGVVPVRITGGAPNIYHRKRYEAELDRLPDYRITCMFVDKKYRRKAVTAVALEGALDLIAQAGGGVVEGYPHDTEGRKVSVLYNGTRSLFERAIQLRPAQGPAELRDAQNRPARLTADPRRRDVSRRGQSPQALPPRGPSARCIQWEGRPLGPSSR